jgi:hypothetical protein
LHLLPVEAGKSPETLRGHRSRPASSFATPPRSKPAAAASAIHYGRLLTTQMNRGHMRQRFDGLVLRLLLQPDADHAAASDQQ